MGRIEKTVFISYRRRDEPWALAVFGELTRYGYDVFIDYDGIGSGNFEAVILENIKARAHFVVLLTPTALERCADPKDWMRREIETAIESQRNIVPLMLTGFDFGAPACKAPLVGKLVELPKYNGLPVPQGFFAEAMARLRNNFLNVPVDAVLHPASVAAQQVAIEQNEKAKVALEKAEPEDAHQRSAVTDEASAAQPDSNVGEKGREKPRAAAQANTQMENQPIENQPIKKRSASAGYALAAGASLAFGILVHFTTSSPVVVAASDLIMGDDCQLSREARIIGSAVVTLPAMCAAAKVSLYEIAEGAKVQMVTHGETASGPPPASSLGTNGSNGQGFGAPGGNGGAGGIGAVGAPGSRGVNVEVLVRRLNGSLSVSSNGTKGGAGGQGGQGGRGGAGTQGTPAQNNGPADPGHCNAWNGVGGRGGNGGLGGTGGMGGSGGDGGKITVSVGSVGPAYSLRIDALGGPGGDGGVGGPGGEGGPGGPPGALAPPGCSQNAPGRVVTNGATGPPGHNGQLGQAGVDGAIVLDMPSGERKIFKGQVKLP
jgi:hypothetical protein